MADITGKYKMVSASGFEEFCKEFVPKIQQEDHLTVEYAKVEGKDDEIVQTRLFGNNFLQALFLMDYGPLTIKLGEKFTHKDLSGSDSQSVITLEGNVLTHRQFVGQGEEGVVEFVTVREFHGDKMTTTISAEGVEAKVVTEFEKVH